MNWINVKFHKRCPSISLFIIMLRTWLDYGQYPDKDEARDLCINKWNCPGNRLLIFLKIQKIYPINIKLTKKPNS